MLWQTDGTTKITRARGRAGPVLCLCVQVARCLARPFSAKLHDRALWGGEVASQNTSRTSGANIQIQAMNIFRVAWWASSSPACSNTPPSSPLIPFVSPVILPRGRMDQC